LAVKIRGLQCFDTFEFIKPCIPLNKECIKFFRWNNNRFIWKMQSIFCIIHIIDCNTSFTSLVCGYSTYGTSIDFIMFDGLSSLIAVTCITQLMIISLDWKCFHFNFIYCTCRCCSLPFQKGRFLTEYVDSLCG
jgi:hypothetical protein